MTRALSAARPRARLNELDAWVLEEVDALARRFCASAPEAARPRPAQPDVKPAPVPPAPAAPVGFFDEAETAFIKRGAEWLAGRPNADMILEELWRLAIDQAPSSDPPDEESDGFDAQPNSAEPEDCGKPSGSGDAAESPG